MVSWAMSLTSSANSFKSFTTKRYLVKNVLGIRVVSLIAETQVYELRAVALSSGVRSFRHVVLIIPFRAATISDPFISLGIPALSGIAKDRRFRLRFRM